MVHTCNTRLARHSAQYKLCLVLYCIVLHCIALHCTALHCTALHCTVLYCTVLYCIVLYYGTPVSTVFLSNRHIGLLYGITVVPSVLLIQFLAPISCLF